jgi:hypothetical protein
MGVLQPAGLLYRPLWTFQLWPPEAPAATDAFRTLAAEVGTLWAENKDRQFCLNADFHGTFRVLLNAANLRHGTHGFTSLPKEGVLRIFPPLKIRRLRPSLNPRTCVPEASTLTPRPPKPPTFPYSNCTTPINDLNFSNSCQIHVTNYVLMLYLYVNKYVA